MDGPLFRPINCSSCSNAIIFLPTEFVFIPKKAVEFYVEFAIETIFDVENGECLKTINKNPNMW